MKSSNIICILAKNPRIGKVKCGLECVIGDKQAALLARALLLDVMAAVLKVPRADVFIAYWPPEDKKDFEDIINLFKIEEQNRRIAQKADTITLVPQDGESSSARLINVSKIIFEAGAKRMLFVCSDNPLLDSGIIRIAFELLKEHRAVLGPTFDGGFYLFGLDGPYSQVVDNVDWSPGKVYRQIKDNLEASGMPWQELEISYDIDRPEELEQLYNDINTLRLTGQEDLCRHTEKYLENLRK